MGLCIVLGSRGASRGFYFISNFIEKGFGLEFEFFFVVGRVLVDCLFWVVFFGRCFLLGFFGFLDLSW